MREYHSGGRRTTLMYGHSNSGYRRENSVRLVLALAEPAMSVVG